LIQYLRKIGPNLSKDVRRDKRFRPDGKGGNAFRGVETGEEAHEVVKEIEETNAGQRALNNSTFTHGPENKDRPKKEKKPDKVLVQGAEAADAGKLRQVCFDMRDRGTCARGKDCKYVHDKAVVDEARKKALRDKKSAGNSQERTSKHSSYRDDHKKEGGNPMEKRTRNRVGSTTPLEVAPAVRSAPFRTKDRAAHSVARVQDSNSPMSPIYQAVEGKALLPWQRRIHS
jgi:hypothetical protein